MSVGQVEGFVAVVSESQHAGGGPGIVTIHLQSHSQPECFPREVQAVIISASLLRMIYLGNPFHTSQTEVCCDRYSTTALRHYSCRRLLVSQSREYVVNCQSVIYSIIFFALLMTSSYAFVVRRRSSTYTWSIRPSHQQLLLAAPLAHGL